MKPTADDVLKWVSEIWGIDPAKPWHRSALDHLQQLAALAYAAGAADMKERCAKVAEWYLKMPENDVSAAIRALGDNDE